MNELLTIRCTDQGGVFTRADATACGYDDVALRDLVHVGECLRLARGVYGVTATDLSTEDVHRRMTRGLLRRYAGRAAASHHSALLLHDLPVYGVDLVRAHLVSLGPSRRKVRRLPEVTVHRPVPAGQLMVVDGSPLVRPGLALTQNALLHDTMAAVVSADAALHRGLVTVEELTASVAAAKGMPGSSTAALMLLFADGRSESPGETRLRLELAILRIPVIPQFTIVEGGQIVARADFRVKGTMVLIEFDGMVKYRGEKGPAAVVAEKKREDRVRRLGYEVERVIWSELNTPSVIGARVRTATVRAASRGGCSS